MTDKLGLPLLVSLTVALSACNLEQASKPPIVRPVLTIVVAPTTASAARFAGTIQPRVQSDLAFQLLGRIISRAVRVGERVVAGQTVATLDPLSSNLAVQAREADLARAQAALQNASAAFERQAYLAKQEVVSASIEDAARQAKAASEAGVKQAQADLDKAREQLAYTALKAEFDGGVTSTFAETGQTVAAGQKVLTIAQTDLRDAVIDLPEAAIARIPIGTGFRISLQSNPSISAGGKVREIAPQADPTTRSHRVRISVAENIDAFLLGATITAARDADDSNGVIRVPKTAVLKRNGSPHVWVVDTANKTVSAVKVELGQSESETVVVRKGLFQNARIVVAGANSLTEGQPVKIAEMDDQ